MLYRHKGFWFGVGVVVISQGLDMMDIATPNWLGQSLLIIGGVIILWTAYMAWKEKHQTTDQANSFVERTSPSMSNILHIERQEPSNRPPLWLNLIGITASLLLLAVGIFQTYLVLSGTIIAKLNLEWIAFYLLFGILPIWLLIEPFTLDRKYYKSGRSATAMDGTYVINGDITDVFNRCFSILETMKAKIIKKNTPSLVKARIDKSNISVEVGQKDDKVQVYIISDAHWVTVKIGRGRNQRLIDEFQKHLIDEFRVSKPDNTDGIQPIVIDKPLKIIVSKCYFPKEQKQPSEILTLIVELAVQVTTTPVEMASLQLCIGTDKIDPISPVLPITIVNSPTSYLARYDVSILTLTVRSDTREAGRILTFAMGQEWLSGEFQMPYDSPLLPQEVT